MAYHRSYYNHYGFMKPTNEQYTVPSIQVKCSQSESLSKFDIDFNNFKTNDNIQGQLYVCGDSNQWTDFLRNKTNPTDITNSLASYKISVKETKITGLTQLKNNKIKDSFFSNNADNFMMINLDENDYVIYKDDEYVFIQDQSTNPKITEKELNDMVGRPYEYSYAIMIFLAAVVITAISAFGIMKYFESKRQRKT